MAENPLLPHRRLKELYALMQRVDAAFRQAPSTVRGLEAVFAATLIQLEQGDAFCGMAGRSALAGMQSKPRATEPASLAAANYAGALRSEDLPALTSITALGMKVAQRKNVAVMVSATSTKVDWSGVLDRAQAERVPFVPILVDRGASGKAVPLFSWATMTKLAKRMAIPTISVDGEDAVALYRVVQECLHRARLGDGPAVIWCSFPSGKPGSAHSKSIASMEAYLSVRGLLKSSRKAVPVR